MNRFRQLACAFALAACLMHPAFLFCQNDAAKDSSETDKVYHPGDDGLTPPRAIYTVDPTYDDASRRAKLNGYAVLTLVVTRDGTPKEIRITKSLSPSLDKRSIEAVSKWRFSPATKDGKPVAVEIQVQTTLKLY